jgi:glycosyltransferase involved in cell wall biosynthesis
LKWLQWSKSDLEFGLGGVEEHARCIARELRRLGVEVYFSNDRRELQNDAWDVVHTHGGEFAPPSTGAVALHTLHGTTLGRMAACGEWFWPGGYLAEMRELAGVLRADAVVSVHPGLSLFHLAHRFGKVVAVCGNGWDAGELGEGKTSCAELPKDFTSRLDASRPLWVYVGRGEDRVKGVDRLIPVLRARPAIQFAAAPGSGFEGMTGVLKTGRLDSAQVRLLLERAQGMIVPSRYEGNSLVVLEALGLGLPVISTRVGGATAFPEGVQGFTVLRSVEPGDFLSAIEGVEAGAEDLPARQMRAEVNRKLLPRWSDVAKKVLSAAVEAQKRKPRRRR